MTHSIISIYRRFPTHADCIAHLEAVRWRGQARCPICFETNVTGHQEAGRRNRWQCLKCQRSFSVTAGTIFHNSHVDLQRWFLLISLMLSAKKGLSAMQAARDLEMRRPTVWSMMHRVRAAMKSDGGLLTGLVEMDETFVGGKPRKANRKDDRPEGGNKATRGHGTKKTPVLGMIERGGKVKAKMAMEGDLSQAKLADFVRANLDCSKSVLHTDEYGGYNGLNTFVFHRRINHSQEYSKRDLFTGQFGNVHTNTIEGFWAIMKRAIYGQFHHVSKKYMDLYVNELTWRFNNRKNEEMFNEVLVCAVQP